MDRLLLTLAEAAKACAVSERTLRRAITAGHLEAHRLGEHGAMRVKPAALDAWLDVRSTLREPRAPKPIPVLPPITRATARRRPLPAGRFDVFGDKKAA